MDIKNLVSTLGNSSKIKEIVIKKKSSFATGQPLYGYEEFGVQTQK